MRIQVAVFDGVDELDFVAPFEVLRAACQRHDVGSEVQLASLGAPTTVVTAHGMSVNVATALDLDADLVVVPGGGWASDGAANVRVERERGDLPAFLEGAHERGAVLASVCTGSMLLAGAGLLQSRLATTHHAAFADLLAEGVNGVRARVVDDGDVVTSGGVTSGIDLALHLVERFWGSQAAAEAETRLEYRRRDSVWHSDRNN